jgi:acyl carrier protein
MDPRDIRSALQSIMRAELDQPGLGIVPESTPDSVLGWDSIKQVAIILAIEKQLSITFRARELRGLKSAGDLIRLIASKRA